MQASVPQYAAEAVGLLTQVMEQITAVEKP